MKETHVGRVGARGGARMVLGLIALVSVSACGGTVHIPATPREGISGSRAHDLAGPIAALCSRLEWGNCNVWDFTDDQRLQITLTVNNDKINTFGPWTFVAPAPMLAAWTADSLTTSHHVAIARVDTTPGATLHPEYQNLQLSAGDNCIYLHNTGTSTSPAYRAAIRPVSTGSDACPTGFPAGATLRVYAVAPPSGFSGANIPGTVRIHEGTHGSAVGALIGLKCADRWCFLLPDMVGSDTVRPPHKGRKPNLKTWEVPGWGDVQHLALWDASASRLVRSDMRASILPSEELTTGPFVTGVPKFAATILFKKKPRGQYESKWAFRKGENDLFLTKTAAGTWVGEVHSYSGFPFYRTYVKRVVVNWHSHTRPFDKAARFMWLENDDAVWVACEAGCCEVTAD